LSAAQVAQVAQVQQQRAADTQSQVKDEKEMRHDTQQQKTPARSAEGFSMANVDHQSAAGPAAGLAAGASDIVDRWSSVHSSDQSAPHPPVLAAVDADAPDAPAAATAAADILVIHKGQKGVDLSGVPALAGAGRWRGWRGATSKARRVLPVDADSERACESAYECAPAARAERWTRLRDGPTVDVADEFLAKTPASALADQRASRDPFALQLPSSTAMRGGGAGAAMKDVGVKDMGVVPGVAKSAGAVFRACDPVVDNATIPFAYFGGQAVGAKRRRYFVGVGINYLEAPESTLTSCWNDVEALRVAFEKRHGPFDRTWTLADRPATLAGRGPVGVGSEQKTGHQRAMRAGAGVGRTGRPTAAELRGLWSRVVRHAQDDGVDGRGVDLVFVYSGHGTFRQTMDPGRLNGQSDALVLLDELFYDYDVMAQLVRPLPAHVRLLIVFDSCNSGSAAQLPWTYNPLSRTANQTSLHTDLTNDVVMISGCRDEQNSASGLLPTDLSACTRVLLHALSQAPNPGSLPVADLVTAMRRRLIADQDPQIPQLSLSRPTLLAARL
jgi:hypothetical protein